MLMALLSLIVWYLFIKEYDYKFEFKANSGAASAYQEIKSFEKLDFMNGDEVINIDTAFSNFQLLQKINSGDTSILMEWNFKYENDSLTHIEVNTVDHNNKLQNRISILNPFQKSKYVTDLAKKFTGIKQILDQKQEAYIVKTQGGIEKSPGFNCICTSSINIPVEQKALEMMSTIEVIEEYFVEYNLTLKGYPFLKVTNWDIPGETIAFDFCFPVDISNNLKETHLVKIKSYPPLPSLKADFRGNYRQSHLAWYELLEKGKRENLKLEPKPLEVFFNNPRMGETSISWKAEIFMPLNR